MLLSASNTHLELICCCFGGKAASTAFSVVVLVNTLRTAERRMATAFPVASLVSVNGMYKRTMCDCDVCCVPESVDRINYGWRR